MASGNGTPRIKEAQVLETQLPPEDIDALIRRVASTSPTEARCGGVYCEQSYDDAAAAEQEAPAGPPS